MKTFCEARRVRSVTQNTPKAKPKHAQGKTTTTRHVKTAKSGINSHAEKAKTKPTLRP